MRIDQYLVCLMAVLSTANPCFAAVYKWTDDQGNVHFSDSPQAPSYQHIPTKAHYPVDETSKKTFERQQRYLDAMAEERQAEQKKQAAVEEQQRVRQENCKIARKKLAQYEHSRYLYRDDGSGESTILSDAERQQATTKLRQSIQDICSDP